MVHTLQTRKIAGMLMQLDLSKAFDKDNWQYLEVVLTAFGFDHQWIKWILALIKSSNFSILVNGSPLEPFSPSRGIRQGDPLSPFLFVILMEGLSRLIRKAKAEGNIRGLHPPATTHQQFMDDTMLHDTPTVKEAKAFKNILSLFSKASGMEINHAKSTIFFFNTHLAIQKHLSNILGFRRGNLPSKYLGAPLTSKPWQKHHWEKILAKLENKCRHWTHRALNFAGRLVLTKAILQAIPQYMFSILPAPQGILHKIRTIQRSFIWKGNSEKNKWALVACNKLCKSKAAGGLNLIDPHTINMTCGAKLWWRWLKEPTLPWARHWKEKYTPNCSEQDLIRLQDVPEGSPIWNLARRNRNIIQDHSFWEICNRETTFFWEDAWQQLPRLATPELENIKRECQSRGNYRVHQYWSNGNSEQDWREWSPLNTDNSSARNDNIRNLLSTLNKRKIRTSTERDKVRWGMKGSGNFTLKEAREQLEHYEYGEVMPWSIKVWDALFWPKIKTFLWLLMQGKTLTWENLCKKGFSGPSICPLCRAVEESINHLFNTCEWAEYLWKWIETTMQQSNRDKDSIQNTILHWPSDYSNNLRINSIWKLILEKCSAAPDSQLSTKDQHILKIFKLDNGHSISTTSSHQEPRTGPLGWHRPPVGFLKLNFNGASRGNPELAGIGGVIRNHNGEILYIYSQALGEGTNNEMEFAALEKGLRILSLNRTSNVVIEGDSEVSITAARKIYRGTPTSRVTKHWRLAQVTDNIAKMLKGMKGLTFQVIRRNGNMVADHLANFRIEHPNARWDSWWKDIDYP
eukprot:PITA_22878